jgi:hypothetical protein
MHHARWLEISRQSRSTAPLLRPAIRLLFELYALALRNPRAYPGVLEDPLAYWQRLTEKAGIPAKPDAVEATLLLAATRGLLLDLCATGDRARVERAMEALAQFVEWRHANRNDGARAKGVKWWVAPADRRNGRPS